MCVRCNFKKIAGFHCELSRIEIDPVKIKGITEMLAPRSEREVRGFLGRINYIGRFIAKLTTTCEPFCKLL